MAQAVFYSIAQPSGMTDTGRAPPAPQGAMPALQAWVEKINGAFGFSVGWIVKAGDYLLRAKAQLGHGQWGSLFGPGRLKFGLRTAEMLMQIARHRSLRNSKNFSFLPSAWSALHALSKLPAEIVEHAIASGCIHSQMTLQEARQLAKKHQAGTAGRQTPSGSVAFDPGQRLQRVARYLRREAADWPWEHKQRLAEALQQMAVELLTKCHSPDAVQGSSDAER